MFVYHGSEVKEKLARHLEAKHPTEELVMKLAKFRKPHKKSGVTLPKLQDKLRDQNRRAVLKIFRKKGRGRHNAESRRNGKGTTIPAKRSKTDDPDNWLECEHCLDMVSA